MSIRNRDKFDAVNNMVKALFVDSLEAQGEGPLFAPLTMEVPSKSKSETHNWLKNHAVLREWVGPRQVATFEGEGLTIVNKPYEATIGIDRVDYDSDNFGLLKTQIAQLTEAYFRGRRKILADLVLNGHTTTGLGKAGYDGVAFFSNAHPNAELAAQSNVAASGAALDATTFDAAIQAGMSLVNHKGEPLDIMYDTLVVGPALQATVRNLFNVSTLSGGGENPHYKAVPNVIVEPRLGSSTAWFLFDTSKVVKPVIWQTFTPIELASLTSATDANVFSFNQYQWGIYAVFGAGYGLWQTGYRNAGS